MATATSLRGRHLITLDDWSREELTYLLDLSAELKQAKSDGHEEQRLRGKNVALIFEKDSTRTRCAFEVAAYDQGAHVTYLGPSGSHIGSKESVKDTARVLGRYYDAIQYRGFGTEVAEGLAGESGARIALTEEVAEAVAGCDVLVTDVWVSMGEPKEAWVERIELLTPYRVTAEAMAASRNPDVKF